MARQTEAELRAVKDGKVLRGRDGWLFLHNDTNDVVSQHRGELRLSSEQVDDWCRLLETRSTWLEELGVPYFFLVAPNVHAIYPEKLPADIDIKGERPIEQIIGHLSEMGSDARLIYPLDPLRAARERRPVCSESDSHWNMFGAFIAYRELLREIEKVVPVRMVSEDDAVWGETVYVGDLGYKVEPYLKSTHVVVSEMQARAARLVHDNCVLNNGTVIEVQCAAAPDTTCLVLGDSSAHKLLYFMAESFGRLVFAHTPRLDFDLVQERKPDVVVSLMTERFLVKVPNDLPAKSVYEVARRRLSENLVRAPVDWWEPVEP